VKELKISELSLSYVVRGERALLLVNTLPKRKQFGSCRASAGDERLILALKLRDVKGTQARDNFEFFFA
jgi:hypothetical protein